MAQHQISGIASRKFPLRTFLQVKYIIFCNFMFSVDLEADVDIILLAMVVAALNAILINNWVSSENVLTSIF